MDAEHRHELKRNELAEALSHLKEWRNIDRQTLTTIAIVVVIILGWIAVKTWSWAAEQSRYNAWQRYSQITRTAGPDGMVPLDELRSAAKGGLSSEVTPLAKLELADALIRNADLDSVNHDSLLGEAMDNIKSVIPIVAAMESPVMHASALLTKARIEESLGQYDAARQTYAELQQPKFAGSPYTTPLGAGTAFEQPSLVEQRLESLGEVTDLVALKPGFPPTQSAISTSPSRTSDLPTIPELPALQEALEIKLGGETSNEAAATTEPAEAEAENATEDTTAAESNGDEPSAP
jgi:predicted negative regulator of RcsB-dependent stress response